MTRAEKIMLTVIIIASIFFIGASFRLGPEPYKKPKPVQDTITIRLMPGKGLWDLYSEYKPQMAWDKWQYKMREINNIRDIANDMSRYREIIILKGDS